MTILLGAVGGSAVVVPPEPPNVALPQVDRSALLHVLTGCDRSVWEISDGRSGVRLKRVLAGLHFAPEDRYADPSPATPGSLYRGSRTTERKVTLRVGIYSGGSSQDWYDYDSAFWHALDPRQTCLWSVTQPNGQTRTLRMRYTPDEVPFETDPGPLGWALYDLTFLAEDPYWHGPPVVRVFEEGEARDFFGGGQAPGGPPFYISPASTLATATIDNPGDVPGYLTYQVDGPTASVGLGVGGRMTDVPFAIPSGLTVTVDTSPTGQVAVDSTGRDRTAELTGAVSFAPVPPGKQVPLQISMIGTGRVTASLDPGFYRAW